MAGEAEGGGESERGLAGALTIFNWGIHGHKAVGVVRSEKYGCWLGLVPPLVQTTRRLECERGDLGEVPCGAPRGEEISFFVLGKFQQNFLKKGES